MLTHGFPNRGGLLSSPAPSVSEAERFAGMSNEACDESDVISQDSLEAEPREGAGIRGELETAARSSGARLHTPAAVGQLGNRVALVRGRLGPLGDGPQSIGWLNRDSSAEYPETSDEDDEGE